MNTYTKRMTVLYAKLVMWVSLTILFSFLALRELSHLTYLLNELFHLDTIIQYLINIVEK